MLSKKIVLLILDGWGYRKEVQHNAVALSYPKNFNYIWDKFPHTLLSASGEMVGLPQGQMGNSEVGHTNIGAGRVVYQDLLKINKAVDTGIIDQNKQFLDFLNTIKNGTGRLHFMGLLSDGGVHSHINHLKEFLKVAKKSGVKEVYIHAFMDGRDTPPNSGINYIRDLEHFLTNDIHFGQIATVTGRYFAMDRDQRWDRVERAFKAIRFLDGLNCKNAIDAVNRNYTKGNSDEFIEPSVIDNVDGSVKDGDGIFFFNFRADRAREMSSSFIDNSFSGFNRSDIPNVHFMTMTEYEKAFTCPVAFPPEVLKDIFGEIVSREGLRQLRIAETEKYAHVTFFFNGGRELVFDKEERVLVASPRDVPTYDLKPEMSVSEVTSKFKERFCDGNMDVFIMNFANPDMVGHTGVESAAIKACKAVDDCLGEIIGLTESKNVPLLVTADHGNCEQMWDYEHDQPHTAHTTNPVPFIINNYECKLVNRIGSLADIAPTMLDIMGIPKPEAMTGNSLIA